MKMSVCKSYDDLPLFLNANLLAQVLGVSISTAYEVMHEPRTSSGQSINRQLKFKLPLAEQEPHRLR